MTIFYLILAHQDYEQLDRMISALDHENAVFIIHIDKKTELNSLKNLRFYNKPNCKILRKRYCINWGGYNMVKATISLISAALKYKNKGYCVLLSGADYPIKSPQYIYDYLSENYGKEYIQYDIMPCSRWTNGGMDRVNYHWFIDSMGFWQSKQLCEMQKSANMVRLWFEDFNLYGGSQWWCLTTECIKYIYRFLKANELYCENMSTTFISDETFFNSIVGNSPFKDMVNPSLKYMLWLPQKSNPEVLTIKDIDSIITSGKLWMRKVNTLEIESKQLLNQIDRYISDNKH